MKKETLWTKDFILISFINFIISVVYFTLMVTIGVYAVEQFGATTSQAGLITGTFIIGEVISRLLIGRYIESIGRRNTLFIGLVFFMFTTILYFINFGLIFLIVNRFIHGVRMGVASTATGTIVTKAIPMSRRGEGVGYFSTSITLATALGPFIGLLTSQYAGYKMVFAFCVTLGLLSFIIAFFIYVEEVMSFFNEEQRKKFKVSDYIEPKVMPIAIIILSTSICYASVLSFINFYALEIDLVNTASFFFLIYAITTLLSRPFSGRLIDKKGANFVMYPGFILFSIGMFVFKYSEQQFHATRFKCVNRIRIW